MTFKELDLVAPIIKALEQKGYSTPTPIQANAIPKVLAGKDLLASAQTGTGKTAAFCIPILQKIYQAQPHQSRKKNIQALILTPTRELAMQISDNLQLYGKYTKTHYALAYGGVSIFKQIQTLRMGVDILVATPGRLLDLMKRKAISLEHINTFVLDEADRMLDMGFIDDIKLVINQLPKDRQTLLFSATLPTNIVSLSNKILSHPEKIQLVPDKPTVDKINQRVFMVNDKLKNDLLLQIITHKEITAALVFTKTKHAADNVTFFLNKNKIKTASIHSDKSQAMRQKALYDFKQKRVKILVATDIAARGLDIDSLPYVFNYDMPNNAENYVHRIGRTGRAGKQGSALSFCNNSDIKFLKDIQRLIKMTIPKVEFKVVGEKENKK